jgi:hypothetical protein
VVEVMTSVVTCPLVQEPSPGHEVMVCVLVVVKTDVMLGAEVMVGCSVMVWEGSGVVLPGHQVVVPMMVSVVTDPTGHAVTYGGQEVMV